MVSSELIDVLASAYDLLELAYKDREEGNLYGASQLARNYEELVKEELKYWHIDYDWALEKGLIEKVSF